MLTRVHERGALGVAARFVVVGGALGVLSSFKPSTHEDVAVTAIEEIRNDIDSVTILDRRYGVEPAVAAAIREYPRAYYAGVIGPDGYPDLVFGQSIIHPDTRCNNGARTETSCTDGSFTYEWLEHVFTSGREYHAVNPNEADRRKALAFTYGYLTHAAGDLWGHTLVNSFAGGIFPSIAEMAGSTARRNIGVRHIVVEGYMGKHTPGPLRRLDAPTDFVYQTFIASAHARELGDEGVFDMFLDLRAALQQRIDEVDPLSVGCLALTSGVGCAIYEQYLIDWRNDIDEGLRAWPDMADEVANAMFYEDSVDLAIDAASDFGTRHVLRMLGTPDAISAVAQFGGWLSDLVDQLKPELDPLRQFKDWICKESVGMTCTQLKDYLKNPGSYITATAIGLSAATKASLDTIMGLTPAASASASYDRTAFAPYANAVMLSRLLLLSPQELDRLLYDLHIGKIYTGNALETSPMKQNAMLGFVRSLDANHQWRRRSPTGIAEGNRIHGGAIGGSPRPDTIGMPLWTDCLARERAFRKLFTDWVEHRFPDRGEGCDLISDPLPPADIVVTAPRGQEVCLAVPVRFWLNNHKDEAQRVAFFLRVISMTAQPETVFHRVLYDTVPPLSAVDTGVVFARCEAGRFKFETRVFERMDTVPESPRNQRIEATPPLLPLPVADRDSFFVTLKDPQQCPLITTECHWEAGPLTGSTVWVCEPRVSHCTPPTGPTVVTLDLDGDSIPDRADNCYLIANSGQEDTDADRVGNVCEPRIVPGWLKDWTDGRVPDVRFHAGILELIQRGLFLPREIRGPRPTPVTITGSRRTVRPDTTPIDAVCLTCAANLPMIKQWMRSAFEQNRLGRLTDAELLRRFEVYVKGVPYRAYNAQVVGSRFDAGRRTLTLDLRAVRRGTIALDIPADIMDTRQPPTIRLDGQAVRADVRRTRDGVTVTIPFSPSSRRVEIQAQRIGPT